MKFLGMIALMVATQAFAEVPTVRASKVTCKSLKDTLEQYGAVRVKKKVLLFNTYKDVVPKAECGADQNKYSHSFRTLDMENCTLGEYCQDIYVPSSSSSDSYDSSWRDSGSSSRGDSYDPPSSGSRGDSYDPPSSDYRGDSYCPRC